MGHLHIPSQARSKMYSWCDKKIQELKGKLGPKYLNRTESVKELTKDTGIVLKPNSLHYQLYAARRRIYGVREGGGRKESVYQKSNILLVISDQVKGFDTFNEVKKFISLNVIMLREIIMFEKKEINVDYKITKK